MIRYAVPIYTKMKIHSLNGEKREAALLGQIGDNDFLAEYDNKKCHAIFNFFANCYYLDDVYGVVTDKEL